MTQNAKTQRNFCFDDTMSPFYLLWDDILGHCTEVGFACFLSGGFITAIVVNPPERKLAKRTSVHCFGIL